MAIERVLTGNDLRSVLGKEATLEDVQRYVKDNVAGEIGRIVKAEKLARSDSIAPRSFYLAFAWG